MTVYFDNAATTRPCPEAVRAVSDAMTEIFANPSSSHRAGRAAKALLDASRAKVAAALGAKPEEIFFTSGGTEADNWAVLGGAYSKRHEGRHIITTAAEHDAVLNSAKRLAEEGWEVTYLAPDASGAVTPESLEAALRDDTVLVSVMLVNNETGAINPVSEMAEVLRSRGSKALLHTDAVQAFLKIPFTPATLGADMITVNSHKVHGPKGAGALWIKPGVKPRPILCGGGQENGVRPGTEALPAIAGFAAAVEIGVRRFPISAEKIDKLREYLVLLVRDRLPDAVFIGGGAPHIQSLSLPGYRSEVLMNFLDAAGIAVSKSSACKKGARSHVLEAMGLPANVIDGAIRVSLSQYNTPEEAEYFADTLAEAAAKILKTK